jgi:hypothetical protein
MADTWLEAIKLAPQFVRIAFAVSAFPVLYKPILSTTLLWVDDKHRIENIGERRALSALGISTDDVRSTEEALELFRFGATYDILISDMDRPGQPDNNAPCYGTPEPKGPAAGC